MPETEPTYWPAPGHDVVILTSTPGTRYNTASRDKVKRVTATQISLEKSGHVYRRDDLRQRGGSTYGPDSTLVRPSDPQARDAFGRQARARAVQAIAEILKRWREDEDQFNDVYDGEIRVTLARYRPIIDRYAPSADDQES